jgi:hypothetical protein|tara:strand:- start:480 stop:755 length:276 start_codon:yes stop_codon:yes gene_type:complete
MIEDIGNWVYALLALAPFVATGATEMFKPVLATKFVPFVGAIVGAAFTGLVMAMLTTDPLLIGALAIVGAFAPKQIADRIFTPLGINNSSR